MSTQAPPYRTAPYGSVVPGPWQWLIDDVPTELPDALPDWDYRTDLSLRQSVTVDVGLVRQATGLPPSAKLTLAMVWTASGSGLKAAGDRITLPESGIANVELGAVLQGIQLGGVLKLETTLVLAEYSEAGALASPRRAGSILWSSDYSTRLQGDAPLFPIAVVDFSKTQYPQGAGWHVEIGGDFETATMGALLLLVNERKQVLVDALRNAAKPRAVDRVVLSTVHTDVARTLIEYALQDQDFSLEADYGEESIGSTLQALVARFFPGQSVTHLRRTRDQSPTTFATELQHAVRIFEES
ncbi:hypothetical protein QRX50_08760 [Amycolatopsis carbonis]|uniref:Uncharacterized protein n=1 Tax=Amycolatopsis carbonis TaxID=715471 RepID=A0A9Y2IJC2_9PSEU|nr:hypothetical protein [Amycolatopsis sp. 2-15]WIX80837.1 hypothetical protein QRX50_08760 [Amycolatopsis sp. 2-15]